MNPVVRPETPADIAAIHDVTAAAFLNAPHADHTGRFVVTYHAAFSAENQRA